MPGSKEERLSSTADSWKHPTHESIPLCEASFLGCDLESPANMKSRGKQEQKRKRERAWKLRRKNEGKEVKLTRRGSLARLLVGQDKQRDQQRRSYDALRRKSS